MESLSSGLIEEATGTADHDSVEELEIIFGAIKRVYVSGDAGLARCRRLRSLSLIDCGLERIGSLAPVSTTLERLCLADQGLTSMAGLGSLPQLRWLYLQQNAIAKIEDLERCPRLRVLWLFSNQLESLDGLAELGELRELWVQDNRIKRLGVAPSLSALRELNAAANPVSDYRDLPKLAQLPTLESLVFDDAHFGACPVCSRDDYKESVVRGVRTLAKLDGLAVTADDRSAARDAYLESVLDFNDKVDALVREHRRKAAEVEGRRKKEHDHADLLEKDMKLAFLNLEKLVDDGRANIAAEHARRLDARALADDALEAALAVALAAYEASSRQAGRAQREKADRQDRILEALERRARAERVASLVIADIQYRVGRACQLLGEHSPDFRWLEARVQNDGFALARAYHVAALAPRDAHAIDLWFYASDQIHELVDILAGRRQAPLVLFATPRAALAHLQPSDDDDDARDDNDDALDRQALTLDDINGDLGLVVACRLHDHDVKADATTDVAALVEVARDRQRVAIAPGILAAPDANPPSKWRISADHLLLLASKLVARDPRHLEADLEDLADDDDIDRILSSRRADDDHDPTSLDALENAISAALENHRLCAAADLAPTAAEALQDADAKLADNELQLKRHRAAIDHHRQAQAALLRDAHQNYH